VDSILAKAKAGRATKQMLGQFMTPVDLANQVAKMSSILWTKDMTVLEPGFGRGAFLFEAIEGILEAHGTRTPEVIEYVFSNQIFGVELDDNLYAETLKEVERRYGAIKHHNLVNEDFFKVGYLENYFDLVIGNPPYGGTFDPLIEDILDRKFGKWNGYNLKKETYSFFIAACLDLLNAQGRLIFITSDTFLTINTMSGLRHRLMDQATCKVTTLEYFSNETNQPVLVLDAKRSSKSDHIEIENVRVSRVDMEATANFSWKVNSELSVYFSDKSLGDFIVGTSGMTVGNNDLFVREIISDQVVEPYEFDFFDEPITLENELSKARLNKISARVQQRIQLQEQLGETRRNLRVRELEIPRVVKLPNENYRFYNKAMNGLVYVKPKHVIYWKDDGDAVLTYKKNGNWYLHGVGGQKFFLRSGFTWQLVSPRLNVRYLPEGYILDSGAPCAFLRESVSEDHFWFIFGWCLTDLASEILKTVINHTRNIQSKDVERLPYPYWVSEAQKSEIIELVQSIVNLAMAGQVYDRDSKELKTLNQLFMFKARN
jgi:hypothetical protein